MSEPEQTEQHLDFIRTRVKEDQESGKNDSRVHTRFPPEPNGYLHLGHAKSICLNFGIAHEFGGLCNLRLDDTNPVAEKSEYAEAIQSDVRWLGFDWEDRFFHASDYFDQLHAWAVQLIKHGKAFVCDLTFDEMRKHRGTLVKPGTNSPYRERSVEENLELFERMKLGEFSDGAKTLRAKIDMTSPNLNMRDPVIYRIIHQEHPKTGNKWKIYPSYDFAHGQSDSLEGITHSICTLEFEHHRPLYDWLCENLGIHHPQQIEFARLNLNYTVMSKRKMLRLVQEGHVNGWDDPRMPTLQGMRRRGYTPKSIRDFCEKVGVAKRDNVIEVELLEHCLRHDLNLCAPRRLGVLDPLKVTISNYPNDQVETVNAVNNPEDSDAGTRPVSFSKHLMSTAMILWKTAQKILPYVSGKEVRLKYAYYITCTEVVKDEEGKIIELICEYDLKAVGYTSDGRKVRNYSMGGCLHRNKECEIRLYDRLFKTLDPDKVEEDGDFTDNLNPESLQTVVTALVEASVLSMETGKPFQLEQEDTSASIQMEQIQMSLFLIARCHADSWAKANK